MSRQEFLNELADQLLQDCPAESYDDHNSIARELRLGLGDHELLEIEELNRWPETYSWLIGMLQEYGKQIIESGDC